MNTYSANLIIDNNICDCISLENGGAILKQEGSIILNGAMIDDNYYHYGGTIANVATFYLTNTNLTNNNAVDGGTIFNSG